MAVAVKQLQHLAGAGGLLLMMGSAGATVVPPPFVDSARMADASAEVSTTWYIDAELILLLEKQASVAVSRYRGGDASLPSIEVSVSIDMKGRTMTADFGAGFPRGADVARRLLIPLAMTLRQHAEQVGLPIREVSFEKQGTLLKRYGPEDLVASPKAEEENK